VTCALGDLSAGDEVTVTIATTVGSRFAGTTIHNVVSTSSPTPDPEGQCPTCEITVPVDPAAHLTLTKAPVDRPFVTGGTVSWVVTVRNDGPATARSVTVADTLATGLAFASDDRSLCSASAQLVTCALGDLPAGATSTVVISARNSNPAGTSLANSVSVSSPTPEPEGEVRLPGVSKEKVVQKAARLVVDKVAHASGPKVSIGQKVRYTLSALNDGEVVATDVVLTDIFGSGLRFVSGDGCSLLTTSVACRVGDLAPGASKSVDLVFSVTEAVKGESVENKASAVAGPEVEGLGVVNARGETTPAVARLSVDLGELALTGTDAAALVRLAIVLFLLGGAARAVRGRRRRPLGATR
jgi:uncharacterized repeat protein (TIGR01451 family)